jgi:signal transduction histidine kinase
MNQDDQVNNYLDNISDSSRELVQNLNNIIWSLNPGNDTLQALLAYIREYTAQFLESCEVEFEMLSEPIQSDRTVSEQVKRNIFLVIKEALNNAVKHGKATKVILHIEWKNDAALKVSIVDNGTGIITKPTSKGNGLKNMEKRMKEIGGDFFIESVEGKGTSVFLSYSF